MNEPERIQQNTIRDRQWRPEDAFYARQREVDIVIATLKAATLEARGRVREAQAKVDALTPRPLLAGFTGRQRRRGLSKLAAVMRRAIHP